MGRSEYRAVGDQERRNTTFYQKHLSRTEFLHFCETLRQLPSYASHWEVVDWIDNSNRLVFSVDCIPDFPKFFANFRSKTWTGPGYEMEWVTGPLGRGFEDLGLQLQRFGAGGKSAKRLSCSLLIGNQPVEFTFHWNSVSPRCVGFEINWFFGRFFLLDGFSAEAIDREFGLGGRRTISADFRKRREEEVKNSLGFLKGVRLPSRPAQILAAASKPDEIWRSFLIWNQVDELAQSLESRIFLKRGPMNEVSDWSQTELRKLLNASGASEVCIKFTLQNIAPTDGGNHDIDYHDWLGSLACCRTLSGKCAIFALCALGEAPYGQVGAFLSQDGYAVGYSKIGSNNAKPPTELTKLLKEAEWIRGALPGGENFPHPVYNGEGEKADPVPGAGVEIQIISLSQSLKRWNPPKRKSFDPNSFEGQFEKLSELGFKPEKPGESEDLLNQREKSWYEDGPYLNMISEMGVLHKLGNCQRFWLTDFENPSSTVNPRDAFAILNGLTAMSIDTAELRCALLSEDPERWLIEFKIGRDVQIEWDLDGNDKWFNMTFIKEFNTLLRSYGAGHLIYGIRLDDGKMLLSGLTKEEVSALNDLLPRPFVLVDDICGIAEGF